MPNNFQSYNQDKNSKPAQDFESDNQNAFSTETESKTEITQNEYSQLHELNQTRMGITPSLRRNLTSYRKLQTELSPPSQSLYSMMYLGTVIGDLADILDLFGITILISAAIDIAVGLGLWSAGTKIKKEIEELAELTEQLDVSFDSLRLNLQRHTQQLTSISNPTNGDMPLTTQLRATKMGGGIRRQKTQIITKSPLGRLLGATLIDIVGWIAALVPWRTFAVRSTQKQHREAYQTTTSLLEEIIHLHESALREFS
ncbi:MAG: hypothetical protein HYW77_00905 [Parcubacteria group bacterium]|nr:hypothetical protein [Parcubacteria group bacterium]